MTERLETGTICSRCRVTILGGDLVLRDHGDWYHLQCAGPLASEHPPMEFRGQGRGIAHASNGARAAPLPELPNEAAAVRCVACGEGIARVADLALTASGPTHIGCRTARPSS